jgi:predicted DNA-binding transcriptional regulator AlpA
VIACQTGLLGRLDTPEAAHREASMELANIQDQPAFLTPMQCAAKLQLSRWTIYHWISGGKLGTEQGLRRLGRKRMIDWNALKVAIERGDLE